MKHGWTTAGLVGLAIGMVSFTAFSTLQAQGTAGGATIGAVDVVRVFNEYQRQVDLNGELTQIRTQLEAENTTRRQKLEMMATALDNMDPEDPTFPGKRQEILKLQLEYKNWADLMQARLAGEVSIWSGRVYEEILRATEAIADSRGLEVVLNMDAPFQPLMDNPDAVREQISNRRVLHVRPSANITDAVINTLNSKYASEPKKMMMDINMTP